MSEPIPTWLLLAAICMLLMIVALLSYRCDLLSKRIDLVHKRITLNNKINGLQSGDWDNTSTTGGEHG